MYILQHIFVNICDVVFNPLFFFVSVSPRRSIYSTLCETQSHYSMCGLVVSILDSPAVDPRLNPGSDSGCTSILHLQLAYANKQSALQ